jgi:dipeptidyl aminopeptidase/acylaminoacyl peptidase
MIQLVKMISDKEFSVISPTIASYGSWKSPITSDLIVAQSIGLGRIVPDGDDLYWSELRPTEGGRVVIVHRTPDGQTRDVNAAPFNARTRVHEYGGGAFLVHKGMVYASNFADQRLYRLASVAAPEPLTPAVDMRYADGVMDERRNRILCVREDHTVEGQEAVNTIVSVSLNGDDLERGGQVLVSGNNFYSTPRLSPDGARLAWLTWNHPNMPWDGTELWVADVLADGTLTNAQLVAGSSTESIFQPEWSPTGELYFVAEYTGWWNLYRWRNGKAEALHPMEAEFGEPLWGFAMSSYAFESARRLVCAYIQQGQARLAMLDNETLEFTPIETSYTDIWLVRARAGQALFLGGSPTEPTSVVRLDLATGHGSVLRRSVEITIDSGYFSVPQAIEFPTENGLMAHGFFYPPYNKDYAAPSGERPPLMVISHGGPTGATTTAFSLSIQYWTSRGIAVLDVNYGGSTGYGRAYRQRLNGNWGIVDVDDCVNGAKYLVGRGLVDGDRLAIRGGSAGGYTTLCALTFRNIFKAGASYFGISDAEALARDTHKFESRYLDSMIGPYPERRDMYVARSPIHFTHQLNCALILFQGAEDKVVPPDQSRKMFEAARAKELPVAYLEYEGEQHGFRQAKNIKRSLDAELYFYSKVFKFELAEPVEPVEIENL